MNAEQISINGPWWYSHDTVDLARVVQILWERVEALEKENERLKKEEHWEDIFSDENW